MFNKRPVLCSLIVVTLVVFASGYGLAQEPQRSWVSLDGTRAGTPAEVVLEPRASDATKTTFSVVVHGFFTETKSGPGGPYSKITVPGIGAIQQRGAPSLPSVRVELAVPQGNASATLSEVEPVGSFRYNNVLIWPNPVPESDHEKGTPERFTIDTRI